MLNHTGHRKLYDLERHGAQAFHVLTQQLVVRICRVIFYHRDNRRRADETCDVVDMPVGVIAYNAISQPEDLSDSKISFEIILNLSLLQTGISIRIEQAGFGSE